MSAESITARFVDSDPHFAVHTLLRGQVIRTRKLSIVVGFLSRAGIGLLQSTGVDLNRVSRLIIGHSDFETWQAIDRIRRRMRPNTIKVHMGLASQAEAGRPALSLFRPMMHSKIYFGEVDDESAWALVGSHNLTHHALGGSNVEAGVFVTGNRQNEFFLGLAEHVDRVWSEARPYDPSKIAEYSQWHNWLLESAKGGIEIPDEFPESTPTLVVVIAGILKGSVHPKPGEILYVEVPSQFRGWFDRLEGETHLYLYPLGSLSKVGESNKRTEAPLAFRAKISGLNLTGKEGEIGAPSVEQAVQWHIPDFLRPALRRVTGPLPRPTKALQLKMEVLGRLGATEWYEYQDTSRVPQRPFINRGEHGASLVDYLARALEDSDAVQQTVSLALESGLTEQEAYELWFEVKDMSSPHKERVFRPRDVQALRKWLEYRELSPDGPHGIVVVRSHRRRRVLR